MTNLSLLRRMTKLTQLISVFLLAIYLTSCAANRPPGNEIPRLIEVGRFTEYAKGTVELDEALLLQVGPDVTYFEEGSYVGEFSKEYIPKNESYIQGYSYETFIGDIWLDTLYLNNLTIIFAVENSDSVIGYVRQFFPIQSLAGNRDYHITYRIIKEIICGDYIDKAPIPGDAMLYFPGGGAPDIGYQAFAHNDFSMYDKAIEAQIKAVYDLYIFRNDSLMVKTRYSPLSGLNKIKKPGEFFK